MSDALREHQEALNRATLQRVHGLKRGRVFRHRHLLDPDWTPGPGEKYADGPKALCRITAVSHGEVYFGVGADARKAQIVTSVDRFIENTLGEWVDA